MRRNGSKLINYVNEIEKYCTAIRFRVVDPDIARDLYADKFIKRWNTIETYAKALRKRYGNTMLERFEGVVNEWTQTPGPQRRQQYNDPRV